MREHTITDLDEDYLRVYPAERFDRVGCNRRLLRFVAGTAANAVCVDLSPAQVKQLRKVLKNWLKETEK